MSTVTLKGNPIQTAGALPSVGSKAPDFTLTGMDLSDQRLSDYSGKKLILNIFPSVDTGVCAASVRKFNQEASGLADTTVLCISNDLPFALNRFCGAEGLDNVVPLSAFRSSFGDDYGVTITDSPLKNLLSRSVVVVDAEGNVVYTEQVAETTEEPNYAAVLEAIR
jgi:thiol peroxidase